MTLKELKVGDQVEVFNAGNLKGELHYLIGKKLVVAGILGKGGKIRLCTPEQFFKEPHLQSIYNYRYGDPRSYNWGLLNIKKHSRFPSTSKRPTTIIRSFRGK